MMCMSSDVSDIYWDLAEGHPAVTLMEADMDVMFLGVLRFWAFISTGDKHCRVTLVQWKDMVGVGIGSRKDKRVRTAKLAVCCAYGFMNAEKCTMC